MATLKNSKQLKKHEKQIIKIVEDRLKTVYEFYGDLIYAAAFIHPKRYAHFLTQNERSCRIQYLKNQTAKWK